MKTKAMWLSSERARVPGVAVLQRGVWQLDPMGGYLGPITGALTPLVAVLAGVPTLHLWG